MTEYSFNGARVRIHGEADQEKIKAATVKFLKQAERQRKAKQRQKTAENR